MARKTSKKDNRFLIKWKNKLDIGDPNIFVLRNHKKGLKELIISYKVIYMNVYNIISMDISVEDEQLMIFRHESFQLWESQITGFYLSKNKDFVTINREGINVITLGSIDKRSVTDDSL